ncbi:hypothetical protein R3W88_012412 [Solanum pinnatisectum]|uniref:Reverse transcriptase zinc-binding domain-containing protein n=1 Tax=Solanum pinnatisectum TaxID=50273 RepID=A0AAV9LBT7_9SOLN|nr:hypothetical protein R3W88_012412 [Solanum pinnatisectum]
MGVLTSLLCPLWEKENETIEHLFFERDVSAYVWKMLLQWLNINRNLMQWNDELKWAEKWAKGRKPRECVYKMMLVGAVYHIWRERNMRIFQQKSQQPKFVIKIII